MRKDQTEPNYKLIPEKQEGNLLFSRAIVKKVK